MIKYFIALLLTFYTISLQAKDAYILDILVDPKKTTGKSWDLNNGEPDILVSVDGIKRFKCKNRFQCQVVFKSSSSNPTFKVEVYDKDLQIDDLIGSEVCVVNIPCKVGDSEVEIREYNPSHQLGECDGGRVLAYMEREYITYLKEFGSVRDYGFDIVECTYTSMSKSLTIRSKNWFIGSNLLNYYTLGSTLIVGSDGSDPRFLPLNLDNALTVTNYLMQLKDSLSDRPVIINSVKVKK